MSEPLDPRSLPTAETVRRHVLPDGTILLIRENPTSPAVVIQGLVMTGAVDDPPERSGIGKFMAESLTRGTTNRSSAEMYEIAESLGASFGVSGGVHTMRFGAKCLSQDTPALVELLADLIHHPAFPPEEIEKVRGETLTELEERDHDTRSMTDIVYRRLAYPPGHPYSRPAEGTQETVRAITREDLVQHYEAMIPARPKILSVVGAIDPDAFLGLLGDFWEGWPGRRIESARPLPPVPEHLSPRSEHVVLPGKVQIDLAWGTVGPTRRDEDFVAANVANLVLGGFGLMGRLGLHIREEQGLAYYAASRLNGGLGPGPWVCIAGVSPEHFRRTVATIEREVDIMRTTPVPTDELEDSKAHLTGSLPLKLESNEGMANIMMEIELYELGWEYLLHFPDEVAAIGPEDVQGAVRRYFKPEGTILASAGPEVRE